MDDDWLTLEEAAGRLGITVQRIRDLCGPHNDHGLTGRQSEVACGRRQYIRLAWTHVTRKSVEAYAARMATSVDRRKEAQRHAYAAKAGRKVGMKPCPRCSMLTDDGALCEFCWAEVASAKYRLITGKPLIKTRTVGPEVDAWRIGRLVIG